MRRLRDLNQFRDRAWERRMGLTGDDWGGCFKLTSAHGAHLSVLASVGEDWDHISVSLPMRCPTWAEMELVKRTFFQSHEVAMQLHVAPDNHISVHPYCLHLWRPHIQPIPLPPKWMVA